MSPPALLSHHITSHPKLIDASHLLISLAPSDPSALISASQGEHERIAIRPAFGRWRSTTNSTRSTRQVTEPTHILAPCSHDVSSLSPMRKISCKLCTRSSLCEVYCHHPRPNPVAQRANKSTNYQPSKRGYAVQGYREPRPSFTWRMMGDGNEEINSAEEEDGLVE